MIKNILTFAALSMSSLAVCSQAPATLGKASYAPYPPSYKGWTEENPSGVNTSYMGHRHLFIDEIGTDGKQRPIPTNDWWTDVIVNRFSDRLGALWNYPGMARANSDGFQFYYPTYWQPNGEEVKAATWLKVGALNFSSTEARASDWHDWDVEITLPNQSGKQSVKATLVHGQPFSWVEFDNVQPMVSFSSAPQIVRKKNGAVLLRISGDEQTPAGSKKRTDTYALYFNSDATPRMINGTMRLQGATWVSVALLTDDRDFDSFEPYAASIPGSTEVSWSYDETRSFLNTRWEVKARNLRDPKSTSAPVMQGFLPHAYRYATNSSFINTDLSYLTPRGLLKMATSDNGVFEYAYRFYGMLPWMPAPAAGNLTAADTIYDFNEDVMKELLKKYAEGGTFGDDTYWGGKGLIQMGLNMSFAKQLGYTDLYEESKKKLRDTLTDWLTYTPGEDSRFFSYYPRWGGMIGFNVSYDSDTFNDHHFHYGYFLYAGAMLCLEDREFAENYGGLLRMIAKDYANYDHEDTRFPFLRTLDPWAGHSYAGGLGDHLNDNGNGQESSSESMQGWGGVYLLGVALGDRDLRDAGIFGWMTESRATLEYWFDHNHIKYDYRNSYDPTVYNYDYTKYTRPYNSNLTSKGIGWWTWFSGDAVWMHSIQWMPVSPCLNYLSENLDFARWDYDTMAANSVSSWFERKQTGTDDNGNPVFGDIWADASLGNVVLSFMQRAYPEEAAKVFYRAWNEHNPYNGTGKWGMVHNIDTGHISYFTIHSHLTYGDIDYDVTADCPTANAFVKNGHTVYAVYNPDDTERTVSFFRNGVPVRSVKAAPGVMTVFDAEAKASSLEIQLPDNGYVAPGKSAALGVRCLDQYGASAAAPAAYEWSVSDGAVITGDGRISVAVSTQKDAKLQVNVTCGDLSASAAIIANEAPVIAKREITGVPEFVETGSESALRLVVTDQYGNRTEMPAQWTVTDPLGNTSESNSGNIIFSRAGINSVSAKSADGKEVSAQIRVLPPLPNVALHKTATCSSFENAGSKPEGATDGDYGVRWGSEHSDDQWLMIDLGDRHLISGVSILWETAYGADYDLEVSDDASVWTTAAEVRGNSSSGWKNTTFYATGRYVRLHGIRRGTSWGYSLYEMEVRGVSADTEGSRIVGLDIAAAPEAVREEEPVSLSASAICFDGSRRNFDNVSWQSDKEGRFSGNTFTPLVHGRHTITCKAGEYSASVNLIVDEVEKLYSLEAVPGDLEILEGCDAVIDVIGRNQFKHSSEYNSDRGLYPVDPALLGVSLIDADGKEVDESHASYDKESQIFHGRQPGDYKLTFSYGGKTTSASIRVAAYESFNLALNKPISATTEKLPAVNANDGNIESRWESEWQIDPQYITIDLGAVYDVNRVRIVWEGAYAKDYSVEYTSDIPEEESENDATPWSIFASREDWNGGENLTDELTRTAECPARYIRVICKRRALEAYGYSIREIEVYGSRQSDPSTGVEDVIGSDSNVDVYGIDGSMVRMNVRREELRDLLPTGIYIIRTGGYSKKIIIRK